MSPRLVGVAAEADTSLFAQKWGISIESTQKAQLVQVRLETERSGDVYRDCAR